MTSRSTHSGRGAGTVHEALAALQWMAIIVPPSLGMWVFGAALVGLPPASMGQVLAGAFFAVGLATLLQLALGWRVPVFEGPASIHLATVVVIAATRGGAAPMAEIVGGLLVAGAVVLLLGLAGADRLLTRIFTPAATAAFVLALFIVLLPEATAQAVNHSRENPWGTGDAWFVLAVGLIGGCLANLRPRSRPFALLVALLAAVGARLVMGWPATLALEAGWTLPAPLAVWPRFTLAASIPFALAGLAAGFNVVGSLSAMSTVTSSPEAKPRQGLMLNGVVQGLQSAFVGFVGTVGHLESASVVRMLGRGGRRSLAMAAVGLMVLSFVDPVVRILAKIPAQISGTLLLVLMLVLLVVAAEIVRSLSRLERWLVLAPSLGPALWWVLSPPSGGPAAAMNPMVLCVAVALVAERLLAAARRKAPAGVDPGPSNEARHPTTGRATAVTEERVVG